jgi:hypothetical protein
VSSEATRSGAFREQPLSFGRDTDGEMYVLTTRVSPGAGGSSSRERSRRDRPPEETVRTETHLSATGVRPV